MESVSRRASEAPLTHSLRRVSRSLHADVFEWTLSREDGRRAARLCLKELYVDEGHLDYHGAVLSRLTSGCRTDLAASGADVGMPPVLAAQRVSNRMRAGRALRGPSDRGNALRIVTPWVEGVSLARVMEAAFSSKTPLPLGYALSLLGSVARCIELLSSSIEGTVLVHQDIKPSNVIVTTGPVPKATVIDLDTAVLLDHPSDVVPVGTCGYVSPEAFFGGSACVTSTSDVFSFGMLACEVLTGANPCKPSTLRSRDASFWEARYRAVGDVLAESRLPRDACSLLESCVRFDSTLRPLPSTVSVEMETLARRYRDSRETCLLPSRACEFADPTPLRGGGLLAPLSCGKPGRSAIKRIGGYEAMLRNTLRELRRIPC